MLAVHRGMFGGCHYTFACGIGSVAGNLILFSLVPPRHQFLFSDLSNPTLRTVLAAVGGIVLLPMGLYLLVRAVKEPLRAYSNTGKRCDEGTVAARGPPMSRPAARLRLVWPSYWLALWFSCSLLDIFI